MDASLKKKSKRGYLYSKLFTFYQFIV